MKHLDYAEMGILKRRHGITVRIQSEGVAYIAYADGSKGEYAIEHLRDAVKRPWTERLRLWLAGVSA